VQLPLGSSVKHSADESVQALAYPLDRINTVFAVVVLQGPAVDCFQKSRPGPENSFKPVMPSTQAGTAIQVVSAQ